MTQIRHPLLRAIGLRVRTLRHERGLSQEALADLAHIDRSYMSAIERGLRNVSVLNIARIAGALDVSVHILLDPHDVTPAWTEAAARGADRSVVVIRRPAVGPDGPDLEWKPGSYLSLS
jgi:transcriptional regulator with XRE-family HTH domain